LTSANENAPVTNPARFQNSTKGKFMLRTTCELNKVEQARDEVIRTARRFGQLQQHEYRRIFGDHSWLPSKIDDIPAAMLALCDAAEALVVAEGQQS